MAKIREIQSQNFQPDHDEVDEDVEDGKDEEAVVQILEAAAAA